MIGNRLSRWVLIENKLVWIESYKVRVRGNCYSKKKRKQVNKNEINLKFSSGNCEHTIIFNCDVIQIFKQVCTVRCL